MSIEKLMKEAHDTAAEKGFWEDYELMLAGASHVPKGPFNFKHIAKAAKVNYKLAKLALVMSEVGEAVESIRKPAPDEHCPDFTNEEIELADILIRIFDYSYFYGIRLGEAMAAKMAFNKSRPRKHGKLA